MTLCLILIMTFSIPSGKFFLSNLKHRFSILNIFLVFSYTSNQVRLYNLLRKPMRTKVNPVGLVPRNDKTLSNHQSSSTEYEDHMQLRDTWDSGEDYYFQWANQNRRPVEYLTGRKREAEKVVISSRDRRINGGLWRSGLVG